MTSQSWHIFTKQFITLIINYEFICNDLIGIYVKAERLHNPGGFVSDIYLTGEINMFLRSNKKAMKDNALSILIDQETDV